MSTKDGVIYAIQYKTRQGNYLTGTIHVPWFGGIGQVHAACELWGYASARIFAEKPAPICAFQLGTKPIKPEDRSIDELRADGFTIITNKI